MERHYPAFRELRSEAGRPLPGFIEQEFDAYLKCGRLEEGFLRLRCKDCHAEKLVEFSSKRRGFCPSCGARRMAETAALLVDEVLPERPLRQWVLSLPHALLFLDGAYFIDEAGQAVSRRAPESGAQELQTLVEHIDRGIGRTLKKRGLIERDIENAWLAGDGEGGPLDDLLGHSATYRNAVGPQGRAEAVHAADGAGEAARVA